MNVDLQGVVLQFSSLLGVEQDIGLVLLATLFAFCVLGIWGIDRFFRNPHAAPISAKIQEVPEDTFDATALQEILEEVSAEGLPEDIVEEPVQPESVDVAQRAVPEEPQSLSERLSKTRSGLFDKLKSVFSSKPKLDPEMLEELEYLLVTSDLGVQTVSKLIADVKGNLAKGTEVTEELLVDQLKSKLHAILGESKEELLENVQGGSVSPLIVMMVGVNGVGKTTTCAKLASRLSERGIKVLLVAADTFRAAAVQQLKTWGERLNIPVLSGAENAKPQAVVFDAMLEAKNTSYDVILIDTAGRLHTKANLMQELEGVRNAVQRHYPEGPQEVILVVDGSTGQNALSQAKEFNDAVNLTGLVVTKLDGTPKGGIVVAIKEELGIPVRYIGVGESHLDLRPFDAPQFVDAIFDRAPTSFDEKVSAHGETRKRRRRAGDLPDQAVNS